VAAPEPAQLADGVVAVAVGPDVVEVAGRAVELDEPCRAVVGTDQRDAAQDGGAGRLDGVPAVSAMTTAERAGPTPPAGSPPASRRAASA
jgi:hypothetical protein